MVASLLASVAFSAAIGIGPSSASARAVVVPESLVVEVANRKGAKRVGGTNSKGKGSKYKGGRKN